VAGQLSRDDAFRLIEALRAAGVEKLNFAGGEPTLDPRIGDLLHHARALGMVTSIVTNDPVSQDLAAYLKLVDDGAWATDHALALRAKLDASFQQEEPALLEADLRIDNAKWEQGS
jgi:hypothetical protein